MKFKDFIKKLKKSKVKDLTIAAELQNIVHLNADQILKLTQMLQDIKLVEDIDIPGLVEEAFKLKKELESKFDLEKTNVYEFTDKISIDLIVVKDKNNGTGTKVMEYVCKYADKHNKIIILSPSSDFGGNKNKLIKFYKKFNFVENKGKNKDYEIFETMYRTPRR